MGNCYYKACACLRLACDVYLNIAVELTLTIIDDDFFCEEADLLG